MQLTKGTGGSLPVERCQVCDDGDLRAVIFLGYLPPVNTMPRIGQIPREQPSYPALLLRCTQCQLVQLGLTVDPKILFPPEYPYTSGTTRILRENFAELYQEVVQLIHPGPNDLIVDIGSNDGTLLSNFAGAHQVQGIEPADVGQLAIARGIPTRTAFFDAQVAREVKAARGPARIVTVTNAFAHIEDVHAIVEGITDLLSDDGVFISESHYLHSLMETLQFDTIYHEHLRYYSLTSLSRLLEMHGLEVFHARQIPTHGGSIRVYAARKGRRQVLTTVRTIIEREQSEELSVQLARFAREVVIAKLQLSALLARLKAEGARIVGIGAPSRASTLVNYVGIDDGILDAVLEVPGSHKIGKYMPGTLIPVLDESHLVEQQPDYALLLSWHIADELMPKMKAKGYRGGFIVPLPEPRIVEAARPAPLVTAALFTR